MKQATIILLSMLGAALGWDAGFRVKFGVGPFGNDHYIKLPITITEAKSQDWTLEQRADKVLPFSLAMYCHPTFIICAFYDDTEHAAGIQIAAKSQDFILKQRADKVLPFSLAMYCHPTFIICAFYDDTEYAAGIQIALPESEFKDSVFDWDIQGYIKWTASNGKSYWTKQQYYVNEEYLSIDAQERVANRDPSTLLQAGGSVWVSGNRGELVELTKRPDQLLANGFTEQGCIPGMGNHYWRINKTTVCDSEMFLWFTLNDRSRDLVGTGLAVPGKLAAKDLPKDWFERPGKLAVKAVVPSGPECLYDLASNPGFTTIHIYYVSEPWMTLCWI